MPDTIRKRYLRPNVAVEPLIDRWYAWSHLVPPAPAARNLTERHLPIMESYLNDPDAHAAASRDSRLAGGPFMNYDRERVAEIAELCERTRAQRRDLIELSVAIRELDNLLAENARGFSLQPLYQRVPSALRGYVELGYDLRNQPSFRLVEPLLFRSRYYDRTAQSLALSLVKDDSRPFIFSTPRLDDPHVLHWQTPFDADAVDALFRLKSQPASFSEILGLFNLSTRDESIVSSLFTDQPPPPYPRFEGSVLRWKYFGHACVLVESRDCAILTDPAISYPLEGASDRLTFAQLPPTIDFVLLTHAHQDHVLLEMLLPLRSRIGTILVPKNSGGRLQDPSLKLTLEACGFPRVRELDDLEEVSCGAGSIQAIPFLGEHCDLDIRSKTAYLVRFEPHSILFLADSSNVNPAMYERVHDVIGDVETIFIGMECDGAPLSWIYGPLLTRRLERAIDQSRRANGSDYLSAASIVEQFKCRELYVYAMAQEPWLNFISSIRYAETSNPILESNRLLETAHNRGIRAQRLFGWRERVLQ
jgi:L-ascorbate metabolism protein UlaG (beta-lactamase superfamily)